VLRFRIIYESVKPLGILQDSSSENLTRRRVFIYEMQHNAEESGFISMPQMGFE
jgi:hypothetical protein